VILSILIGWGLGMWSGQSHTIHPNVGLWVTIIGLLGLLCVFFYYELTKKLWPSKEVWERNSSEDPIAATGYQVDRWRTSGNQKKGDYFMLKIVPPRTNLNLMIQKVGLKLFHRFWDIGQDRVIDRIQFMQYPYPSVAFPPKYTITISNNHGLYAGWVDKEFTISDMNGILIKFPRPIKIHRFTIKIVEPADYYWGFGRIDIREVRILGRFWRHTI